MKRFNIILVTCLVALTGSLKAHAQYYQIANQVTNLISPALSGSFKYRGFVEVAGMAGVGQNRLNTVDISTSQGFQYASWFFMGAGLGIDIVHGNNDKFQPFDGGNYPGWMQHKTGRTKVMIPVFSDFRFNIGPAAGTSFFIDLKLGASWLMGNGYLTAGNARLTGQPQFYFRPSIGVRVPVNGKNSLQAFNVGASYQLITSGNNYYYYADSPTFSSLGLSIAYEW